MNVLISLKEYVDLHEDEFFKRFMYNYSLLESLKCYNDLDKIISEVHGSYDNQLDIDISILCKSNKEFQVNRTMENLGKLNYYIGS